MKINIDFNDPKQVKKIVVVLLGLIIIFMLIGYVVYDNEKRQNEVEARLEVEEEFITDPNIDDKVIKYNEDDQIYYVDAPGYETVDQTELETVMWFINNTDLKTVTIKYGGIGGETREYDLTKDPKELFSDNSLVNAPNSEPLFLDR